MAKKTLGQKPLNINNFDALDVTHIGVVLIKLDKKVYTPFLNLVIKTSENKKGELVVDESVSLELFGVEGPKDEVIGKVVQALAALMPDRDILDNVCVFDEDSTLIDKFSLTEYAAKKTKPPKGVVYH